MMNQNPLVSCIIIFLNGEKFIEEAIESVFFQTYPNWELLLVDDGSIDNSTVIAFEYAQKFPEKVYYLEHDNHQNRGMGASRNKGIDHAQGEYIAFLDADDVWLSNKLEQQVAILESQPEAAMVYGRMKIYYSWTGKTEDSGRDSFLELGVPPNTLIKPPKLLINSFNSHYQHPGTSNVMIRQAVFEKVGRCEERFRGWGEDKVLFAKIQLNLLIFVSDKCWIKYRYHPDSLCHLVEKDRKSSLEQRLVFFDWIEQYLLNQGMKNTEVWEVLQTEKIMLRFRYTILYSLWLKFLQFLMLMGRQLLPSIFRQFLWVNIGSKLYR